ncbi:epoxide hydrolase [Meredithblackwellia eburnea MCA 4105]
MRQAPTLKPERFLPTFSKEQLATLKQDLSNARLPRPTYASNQSKYGIESSWMKSTLEYWKSDFDWSKRERSIHSVEHYLAHVPDEASSSGSFKLHFVAHFSEDPNAIPLLLLHGWPGSAHDFYETVKILSKSTSPSFHLIAPNQIGYGWSDPPPLDRGFGMHDSARVLHKLMLGLGFGGGYAAQGGDIGSVLARILSVNYEACKAINISYMPIPPPAVDNPYEGLTEREATNAAKAITFATTGRGYGVMQGTRPGTIGIVVQSSPVALLAWLGEKFRDWVEEQIDLDEFLEIATMWWILESFPTAIYAYSELTTGVGAWHTKPELYLHKPFGFSSFAYEIASAPESWAAKTGNLAFYKYNLKGGHFASMEQPQLFADNMIECFSKIWPKD